MVLRRLDCVLEPTKTAVLKRHADLAGKIENVEPVLQSHGHPGECVEQGIPGVEPDPKKKWCVRAGGRDQGCG